MLRRSLIAGAGATAFVARKAVALTAAQRLLLYSTPSWVLAGASLDFDFENNRYYQQGRSNSIDSLITCSRASTGYVDDVLNTWSSIGANLPRIGRGKGLLVESSRTNLVLWCRDLTNAVWITSNITVALNQVGLDGVVNSASSITATAGNGTILQSITSSSASRLQSAFVKRLIGTGVVNMTTDNGSTWTIVPVTSGWARVTIPVQTLANPTVGFRLTTSGDAIAVDFVQNEIGTGVYASSPIATATVAVVRAVDVVTTLVSPIFGTAFTLFSKATPGSPVGFTSQQNTLEISNSTSTERFRICRNSTTGLPFESYASGGSALLVSGAVALAQNVSSKIAAAGQTTDQVIVANAVDTNTGAFVGAPTGLNVVNIGSVFGGTLVFNGYIERIAIWPNTRLSNADLQRITA